MKHTPTILDIKTDLRRAVMASFSPKNFADINFSIFLEKAQNNLEALKEIVGESKYLIVRERMSKAMDPKLSMEKRREDILTASLLI